MTANRVSRKARRGPWRAACALALACAAAAVTSAQTRPPVVLTDAASTRAVALDALTRLRDPFTLTTNSFVAGADTRTRVMFFVMNLDLLAGEGASALACDAEDSAHRFYKFKVEDVRPVPGFGGLQQVIVRLSDDLGDAGDLLVRLSLHGVAGSRVRISVGHTGGTLADDPGAQPQPAPPTPPAPTPTPAVNPYTGTPTDADAVRLLEQATWGPNPAEVARVKSLGIKAWLDDQFNQPASGYPNMPLMPTDPAQGCPTTAPATCQRDNYSIYPLQVRFFQNALYAPDQLRQRTAWALHQIFVVSGREINFPAWMTYYVQTLDRDAFGSYRTLLGDITLNPAMGEYLNMRGNTRVNPNENYAREIMQLFSVGLDELNTDGTPRLDSAGRRIPTYTQDTITNFARVFTGWNLGPAKNFTNASGVTFQVPNYQDPMIVTRETNHDTGTKTLLNGLVLPANQTAQADLNAALDNLANHQNTGPFIGKQLIQHLVTSNPSPAYVARVARVFNNDCDALYPDGCANQRGNLKAVVRAVLLDPEARGDLKTDPSYGKLREPVQHLTNVLRAVGATAFNNPAQPSDGVLGNRSRSGDLPGSLDEPIFLPETVFSYYSPLYQVPGTDLAGPAFQILSTSTALKRANITNGLIYAGIPTNGDTPAGTSLNFAALDQLAANPPVLVETLNVLLLHGAATDAMKAQVLGVLNSINDTDQATRFRKRSQAAVYLYMTSPQYQVQR
ncbi:MAG TPA: DUF1800 domain-containing protein [Pyrinomonadaceae bacterium]|jgi:uncharacterized protein (DUF1800 family)